MVWNRVTNSNAKTSVKLPNHRDIKLGGEMEREIKARSKILDKYEGVTNVRRPTLKSKKAKLDSISLE